MNNSLGEHFVHQYRKAILASDVRSSQTETAGYAAFAKEEMKNSASISLSENV